MSQFVNIHTHKIHQSEAIQLLSIDYQSVSAQFNPGTDNNYHATLAIHPMDYSNLNEIDLKEFEFSLVETKALAIGETGFDKNSALSTTDQQQLFSQMGSLSVKLNLPVIIHCVGRYNELERALKTKQKSSPAWIIHGFRKTAVGKRMLELGAYLSFGAALLVDPRLQEFVKTVPLDVIFLETDDADIQISEVYKKLAEIKCLPLHAIIEQLYSNYLAVFHHE